MKFKIVFLSLCCLLISSCETVNIPQVTVTVLRDYTPMTDKGIFVTESNSVDFDYVPLGSVVSVTSGAYHSSIETGSQSKSVDLGKAFDDISTKLVEKGANGLINLKIESSYIGYTHYMTVTGMAIRTKEPIMQAKKIVDIKNKLRAECTIDGIKALIIRRTSTGVIISTDKKMDFDQVVRMIKTFELDNIAVQIFLANGNNKAYAGITEDDYYINYETKEFIELRSSSLLDKE